MSRRFPAFHSSSSTDFDDFSNDTAPRGMNQVAQHIDPAEETSNFVSRFKS
jgi:hypothetical protein